jgi:hypothetical protein
LTVGRTSDGVEKSEGVVLEMLSTHLPLEAELEEWTKTIAGLAGADACMSQLREALLRGKGEEKNGGGGLDQALLACSTCWNAIHAENWKNVRGSCQNRLRRTLPTALDVKKVRWNTGHSRGKKARHLEHIIKAHTHVSDTIPGAAKTSCTHSGKAL